MDHHLREFISLTVDDHAFCIDIGSVREIRGWTPATPLPQAPDYVMGMINLRGAVMPVLDLKARLGLGVTEVTGRHVIIVVQQDDLVAGLVVDGVRETLMIDASELQPAPQYPDQPVMYVDALIPRDQEILGRLNVSALLPADLPVAEEAQAA
jgi:purine-binding chemotaxis protein CheW